jgi:hypothetical protein
VRLHSNRALIIITNRINITTKQEFSWSRSSVQLKVAEDELVHYFIHESLHAGRMVQGKPASDEHPAFKDMIKKEIDPMFPDSVNFGKVFEQLRKYEKLASDLHTIPDVGKYIPVSK